MKMKIELTNAQRSALVGLLLEYVTACYSEERRKLCTFPTDFVDCGSNETVTAAELLNLVVNTVEVK